MKHVIKFMRNLKKMSTMELEAVKILTETELRNRSLESDIRIKLEAEQDALRRKIDESDRKRKEDLMATVVNFKG